MDLSSRTNWYTIKVQANHERKIAEKVKLEMSRDFDEITNIILPTEKSFYVKDGKRLHREKVIFPGYFFIETVYPAEVAQLLKNIPGASGLLKNKSGELQTLKRHEVEKLVGDIEKQKGTTDDDLSFSIGEEVKVIHGPFESFKGQIEELNAEKQKVKVAVQIFGRSTKVDLDLIHIEKILL
jgi:transcription termination/antitermination protein NusG